MPTRQPRQPRQPREPPAPPSPAEQLEGVITKGVLLAETFEKVKPAVDPTGWLMSEKLDGVRAYWNGTDFFSRNGLRIDAPEWFKAGMPATDHLDGELWCGREQFERCVGIIKYHKGSTAAEWRHLKFLVFDAPVIGGRQDLPYEQRHEHIETLCAGASYMAAVGIRRCEGREHLHEVLQSVLSNGGEGLMLRQPGSLYVRKRSATLLKVKTFLDAEAKVVGYTQGKNRLQGMLGALQLEMPVSGNRFEIGTGFTDAQRNWIGAKKRWPLGTVLTYKFQNVTAKGVPRFPVFQRVRTDKIWEEVVADAQKDVDDKLAASMVPGLKRAPSIMASLPCSSPVEDAEPPSKRHKRVTAE